MRRGQPFSRNKSLKLNSVQIKQFPDGILDHLQNSVKRPKTELNHISPVTNRLSGAFLNQEFKNESIPMRPLNMQNGQEKSYNSIG